MLRSIEQKRSEGSPQLPHVYIRAIREIRGSPFRVPGLKIPRHAPRKTQFQIPPRIPLSTTRLFQFLFEIMSKMCHKILL